MVILYAVQKVLIFKIIAKTTKEQKKTNQNKENMAPDIKKSLPNHIKLSKDSKEYYCIPCKKILSTKNRIYYHYNCNNNNKKKHKCQHCEKGFSTRSYLNYHMEIHNSLIYKCQKCNRLFSNSIVLKKHLKLHDQPILLECSYCKSQFRTKEALNAHEAKHKNNFNFKCNDCDKKYTTKSALEQHKLKHSAKKYKCQHCEKGFQRNSTLTQHLKRHNSNEFFICSTCFKKFSDVAALQRHSKMHNNDKLIKYKCKECETITIRKDNMQRHIRVMHLSKNFDNSVEILRPTQRETILENYNETNNDTVSLDILKSPNNIEDSNQPKTVANSSVIKFIGNVSPITVPNFISIADSETSIKRKNSTFIELNPVQKIQQSYQIPKKKKYDPIEMYRKILNSDEQTESLNDETTDITPTSIKSIENQQRNTSLTSSNFSETHWRKNFKYTYTQHQE